MKSKVWIYYLILNLALVGIVGFFSYKTYFPDKIIYPDPVTLFEKNLLFGDELKISDPYLIDNNDDQATYFFTLSNSTETEKTYYLYLDLQGDQELIDNLTIKLKDKGLLISYQPNSGIKKISLQPGESVQVTVKIYIDVLQVLDSSAFIDKSITVKIIDDQAAFYGIQPETPNQNLPKDNTEPQDSADDDLAN